MSKISHEIQMRSIKIIDLGFITIIYFAIGLLLASAVDTNMGPLDHAQEDKKSIWQLTLECVLLIWLVGVIIYIVKNLVELIPFPLNGIGGFDHMKVKELRNATVFIFVFLSFQNYLRDKTVNYYGRVMSLAKTSKSA